MDSSVYRHLFGQITNSCVVYHYNFPSHNILSLENLTEVSEDLYSLPAGGDEFMGGFPCYKRFPYAVQTNFPLFCGSSVIDHARELVEKKINWEIKLKKLKISNISTAVDHVKKLSKYKRVKLSEDLEKYICHFHDDPEPMFSGNYNWLYTGGCLSYYDCPYGTVLISADYVGKKPGFYLLKLNKNLDGVEHKYFSPLKAYSPVLQIKCKAQQENVLFCVRQKNCLSLYRIQKENPFSEAVKLWRKKVLNLKLLTCVDLKDNCEQVVLTDTNHDIHVYHVEKKDKISGYCGRKITSHEILWSQVAFGDETLYWAYKDCFAVLDIRDLAAGPKLEYNPAAVGEQCDEICSFALSSCDSNFVYLATNHSALQVDLRNGKTIQKWTHMMKSSPQFMTSIKDDKTELLVLQSQTVGETSGIVNECTSDGGNVNFVSRSLPCLLTSIKDSFSMAHLQGVCLNPFLPKRVNFTVTGLQCLKNAHGEVDLLTKNSAGDVFSNRLRKTGFEDQGEVVERMRNYEKHFESSCPKKKTNGGLEFVNMTPLLESCSQAGSKQKGKKPERRWKYEEKYSQESLTFYKDFLACQILKVWRTGGVKVLKGKVMSMDRSLKEWLEKCCRLTKPGLKQERTPVEVEEKEEVKGSESEGMDGEV